MFVLRFALHSARNKALMGRLGVTLRLVVGGCGRWRLQVGYRVHVFFACLVLSYCPLGHYAVKRYLSHRKSGVFSTGKVLSFLQDGKASEWAVVPRVGRGLSIYTDMSKKDFWIKIDFMARSVLAYQDAVVVPFPNPDHPKLFKVHKKGFVGDMKGASVDEVEEWAGLYPAWYMKRFRRLLVFWSAKDKKVRVSLPKLRSHRSDYYAWIKYLPLPEDGGYWYLLTLTLYREVGFDNAWKNVNRWTSKFLNRFRTYLKTKYGVSPSYLWVVEVHRDGYPHTHILFRMPYIHELNIKALLSMFQSYWVDDEGNPLCAPQGVDLKYIGRDVQRVRDYCLKYLVKNHHKYWRVQLLPDGRVAFRRSSSRMWLYKVKLFGMSQDIRAKMREKSKEDKANKGASDYTFFGSVSANRLHKLVYKPLGIPYEYWIDNLPEIGWMEYSDDRLPELVPSAFNSRSGPSDGVYDELVEIF